MDDMDPDGGNDQQPPSHNHIHASAAMRPSDAGAQILSLSLRSN